ncbi:MAG TPA: hypothetical protein VKD90_21990, partial [Gemmataceae bacterium]|nr:hypothetical protein [Gemmataceae bacterium]
MDSCPTAGQLDRLLADRLDANESAVVSAHVQVCADCQTTLEQLTRQDGALVRGTMATTSVIDAGSDAAFLRRMEDLA